MGKDFSRLDALLEEFAKNSVPGCTCSIMQGDELIYEGAAGYADIASGKKTNGHSMFRQASTTKLFTYAILGMLYEEGKFLFSDPVGKYLPEWSETDASAKKLIAQTLLSCIAADGDTLHLFLRQISPSSGG